MTDRYERIQPESGMNMINDGGPERIWIESDGGCPYFYHEDELSDVGSPVTEYVRADTVAEMIRQAVQAEREACAKVCDGWKEWNSYTTDIAAAIRALLTAQREAEPPSCCQSAT